MEDRQKLDLLDKSMIVIFEVADVESTSSSATGETKQVPGLEKDHKRSGNICAHFMDGKSTTLQSIDAGIPGLDYRKMDIAVQYGSAPRQMNEQNYHDTPTLSEEESFFHSTMLSQLGDFLMAHGLQEDLLWALHI
ncbi:hypothetical protein CBER1_00971 [Cercospora berteroae]|uniref:Uncharacterized protein n=1 Tax=Cercospora berteroae TaxID=357750 RepID=A0A2S6C0R3_9PEZI|nr:hypothetical protein CBER1_00971 [Cercospora berteroae]